MSNAAMPDAGTQFVTLFGLPQHSGPVQHATRLLSTLKHRLLLLPDVLNLSHRWHPVSRVQRQADGTGDGQRQADSTGDGQSSETG